MQHASRLKKFLEWEKTQSISFQMDKSNPSLVAEYPEMTSCDYSGRIKMIRFDPEMGVAWERRMAERPAQEALREPLMSHEYDTLLGKVKVDRHAYVIQEIYEVKREDGRYMKASRLQ